jgi:transcriptional regulator with XRE-family HTH domain
MVRAKSPTPLDAHVGSRIRLRRVMLGMSQAELAEQCGITFQQIQKYEKGKNRVGAHRIQQLSNILDIPVGFFFEDAPGAKVFADQAPSGLPPYVAIFMRTAEGRRMVEAFSNVQDREMRAALCRVVEAAANQPGPAEPADAAPAAEPADDDQDAPADA